MKNSIQLFIFTLIVLSACGDDNPITPDQPALLLYPQNDTIIYIDTTTSFGISVTFAFNPVTGAHQYRWNAVWLPVDTVFWGNDTMYSFSPNFFSDTFVTLGFDRRNLGEYFWYINAYDVNQNIIVTSERRHFSIVPF